MSDPDPDCCSLLSTTRRSAAVSDHSCAFSPFALPGRINLFPSLNLSLHYCTSPASRACTAHVRHVSFPVAVGPPSTSAASAKSSVPQPTSSSVETPAHGVHVSHQSSPTKPLSPQFAEYDGASMPCFAAVLETSPGARFVPVWRAVFSDQLTPVLAYRCLVHEKDTAAPSFLLESVDTGARVGRYSYVGAYPALQVMATAHRVTLVEEHCTMDWVRGKGADIAGLVRNRSSTTVDEATGARTTQFDCSDPWALMQKMTNDLRAVVPPTLPGGSVSFCGGWVGYGGYDTMRYAEPGKLPFSSAPPDDRGLPDLHFGLYRDVIVFDHVAKIVYVVHWIDLEEPPTGTPGMSNSEEVGGETATDYYNRGMAHLDKLVGVLSRGVPLSTLAFGTVSINVGVGSRSNVENSSNMTREQFNAALDRIHTHIVDGDSFQVVFSQRFERWSEADPFSTYRALRVVNPSPYMIYMQCAGSTLVASSPEILCRVVDRVVTNRPLAGTRRRGRTPEEDATLEKELLEDTKDVSEHRMLVDLGRNDVGRIAKYGSVIPADVMIVEHYSNVMHISSTVTGVLKDELSSWDALRAALPVGTVSGAPKIRSMQIIDDLEPTRRGPYGGGIGFISCGDTMNIALALRTMVIPHNTRTSPSGIRQWRYYIQAGAGIVYESDKDAEYDETVNKAMALNRAVDLAETAFVQSDGG